MRRYARNLRALLILAGLLLVDLLAVAATAWSFACAPWMRIVGVALIAVIAVRLGRDVAVPAWLLGLIATLVVGGGCCLHARYGLDPVLAGGAMLGLLLAHVGLIPLALVHVHDRD